MPEDDAGLADDSVAAGFESVEAGLDSVAGLESVDGAPSAAGLLSELDADLGA